MATTIVLEMAATTNPEIMAALPPDRYREAITLAVRLPIEVMQSPQLSQRDPPVAQAQRVRRPNKRDRPLAARHARRLNRHDPLPQTIAKHRLFHQAEGRVDR